MHLDLIVRQQPVVNIGRDPVAMDHRLHLHTDILGVEVGNEDKGVPVLDIGRDPDAKDCLLHLQMDVLGVVVGNEDEGVPVLDVGRDPDQFSIIHILSCSPDLALRSRRDTTAPFRVYF